MVGEGTMRPHLTAAEIAQIELQLAGLASLLEFGCGEATMAAARQVRRIVSVDSDPARLRTVQAEVACEAVEFAPVHIDIGPVSEGGYPAGESRIRDWPRYHTHIWRGMGGSPDAVSIAGRFRVACLLQGIIHCKPDCVFLFHDFERSEEHTSELQSLMRISYAVFCLKKKKQNSIILTINNLIIT